MFLPFRSKNPPVTFPWVTVFLIVANIIIYALTTAKFLVITDEVLANYALIYDRFSVERLFTHMFLHANLLHLIGNMLFLWIFGGSVEGRIGWYLFLPFYLICGLSAGVTHSLISGAVQPSMPMVGASGAIMGLLGAYLWLSPFTHILVYYYVNMRYQGITTWPAWGLVLFYAASDLFEGWAFSGTGAGGTANFAHLGGMATGFLVLMISGMSRESEEFAEAQAARSDLGNTNYQILGVHELEPLVYGPQPVIPAVFTYVRKVLTHPNGQQRAYEAIVKNQNMILEQGDAGQFAVVVMEIPQSAGKFPSGFLLSLGQKLEIEGNYEVAGRLYRYIMKQDEKAPETEVALARYARLLEQSNPDKNYAASAYKEMLRLFPTGKQADIARQALARTGDTQVVFSVSTGQHNSPVHIGGGLAGVGAPMPAPTPSAPVMPSVGSPAPSPLSTPGMAPVGLGSVGSPAASPAVPPLAPTAPAMASIGGTPPPAPQPTTPPIPGAPVPLPPGLANVTGYSGQRQNQQPQSQEQEQAPATGMPQIFLAPVGSTRPAANEQNPEQK